MIIYSVETLVPVQSAQRWAEWMTSVHIPQILETGCFLSARMMRVLQESESDALKYRTDYVCQDDALLEVYVQKFAPALRDDFKKEFPEITQITRTLLKQLYKEDC